MGNYRQRLMSSGDTVENAKTAVKTPFPPGRIFFGIVGFFYEPRM